MYTAIAAQMILVYILHIFYFYSISFSLLRVVPCNCLYCFQMIIYSIHPFYMCNFFLSTTDVVDSKGIISLYRKIYFTVHVTIKL